MIKKIISTIIIVLVLVGVFYLLSKPPQNSQDYENPDLVFYWGDGCPHCDNVEAWIKENDTDKKLKINSREVYKNRNNQTELYNLANQYCPEIIENGNIGVPTGFDPVNQKCIQGDTPIIEFLSSKLTK